MQTTIELYFCVVIDNVSLFLNFSTYRYASIVIQQASQPVASTAVVSAVGNGWVRPQSWQKLNPLKGRGVIWLHFAMQVWARFLISDIRALWHSGLSARVPECQNLKI